jgi:hypothetical protein
MNRDISADELPSQRYGAGLNNDQSFDANHPINRTANNASTVIMTTLHEDSNFRV